MPLLRTALREVETNEGSAPGNLILESNTLLQFLKPSLYLMVLHPAKPDFKESAHLQIDRASAFVWRQPHPEQEPGSEPPKVWKGVPLQRLRSKPQFLQREGEPLPGGLAQTVRALLEEHEVNAGFTLWHAEAS